MDVLLFFSLPLIGSRCRWAVVYPISGVKRGVGGTRYITCKWV